MISDRLYRMARHWPFLGRQARRVVLRLPHRVRNVCHFGQQLLVDPAELHGFYLYYEQEYDDYIFAFLASRMASYRRVLDLGANIGIYTVFFASRCDSVDAFEPEQTILGRLRDNIELNRLTNITIHQKCVANASGSILFVSPTRENEGVGHIGAGGTPRPSICLDEFLATAEPEPLLIKMDIEGGEWLAVQGARRALAQWAAPLSMLIELHPEEIEKQGGSVRELREMLASLGLQVFALQPDGLGSWESPEARFWWATNQV